MGKRTKPYKRRGDEMDLPAGKTCGDCCHIQRCEGIYGHIPEDEVCDWSPIKFMGKNPAANLSTEERKAFVTSFFEKLNDEKWFDRPTVLHGCWKDCYDLATHWAVTGVFSQVEGRPICGILKKMMADHIEAQEVSA